MIQDGFPAGEHNLTNQHLLILEQHSNLPIRFEGQVYSLCQV